MCGRESSPVRKHRAPKGALRLGSSSMFMCVMVFVRKHRAPKGALRRGPDSADQEVSTRVSESTERQKVH